MSPTRQSPPEAADEKEPSPPKDQERGTNAVEHKPDPTAEPLPDGEHKHIPRSPYTTGNY